MNGNDFFGSFFNRKPNAAVVLTKDSGKDEIKQYFTQVCKLHDGGNEFPVDLDTVWPLIYSRKDKAVRALLDNEMFQEGIDFQSLPQNGEKKIKGGQNEMKYMLTVECMEYFVARKERTVFEVYRQVFHAARKQAALPAEYRMANMLIDNLTPIVKSFEVIARTLNERMDRIEGQKRTNKGVTISNTLLEEADIYTVEWHREPYYLLADVLAYWGIRTKTCVVAQSLNRNGVDHAIMLSAYRRNQPAWFVNREGLEMLAVSRGYSMFSPKSGKKQATF